MNNKGEKETKKLITTQQAVKTYGISSYNLRRWADTGRINFIRSPTNIRMFCVSDIEKIFGINNFQSNESNSSETIKVIYCRVSSVKQRDDLERQTKYLRDKYPTYTLISDIGSGINYNREGLKKILELSMSKKLSEVVVAHKDRLARFGFELIEHIFEYNGTKLTIDNQNNEKPKSDSEELSDDLLSIIHVFSCRQMGKRRYHNKNKKNKDLSEQTTEESL